MRVFIFECNDATQIECFDRSLFGSNVAWPLSVRAGELCFLFNYYGHSKLIYGVFKATSNGARNIVAEAWSGLYPCQVRVQLCSNERLATPKGKITRIVTDQDTGRVRNVLNGQHAQDLLQYFAGGYTVRQEHGAEMTTLDADYRFRFPRTHHCSDGHSVRSISELTIDEWLARNQVYHEYERLANLPEALIPDFTVYTSDDRPVFIEFWGLIGEPAYDQRRLRKCEIYARFGCNIVELYPADIQNLDFALRQKLRACNVPIGRLD